MGFKQTKTDVFDKEDKFSNNFDKFSDVKLQKFASEGAHLKDDMDVLNLADEKNEESVYGNLLDKKATLFEISRKKNDAFIQTKKKESKEKITSIRRSNESKEEKKQKIKLEKKRLKKEISKDKKAAASKTAVANMLKARKEMAKEIEGEAITGDAMRDGSSGMLKIMLREVNPWTHMKRKIAKMLASAAPTMMVVVAVVLAITLVLGLLFQVSAAFSNLAGSVDDYLSNILEVNTTERTNVPLTDEEISTIVSAANLADGKKKAIKFALSKVGYPYSQTQRCSGNAFDCSSLCYYSYKAAGVDFDPVNHYPPTAASLASMLNGQKKALTIDSNLSLKAGDLIFYGGSNNNRYLGIYHVALYIGGGKCVEALNTQYGGVYGTVRTKEIVMICRP